MKINKCDIPTGTIIARYLPGDYSDSFCCHIKDDTSATPDDLQVTIWTEMPRWIRVLFSIRNFVVKAFGLKTDSPTAKETERLIRDGENSEIFSITGKSPQETCIQLKDKHLTAQISAIIIKTENNTTNISLSTVVKFHNRLGVLYFYTILPFHRLVVKGIFKQCLKNKIHE